MALWYLILVAFFTLTDSQQINQCHLSAAMAEMSSRSYNGFVLLLKLLNDSSFLENRVITFLMPNDDELSHASLTSQNLKDCILRHSIPTSMMLSHIMHFPNMTIVPSVDPDRMLTITKTKRAELFVNNARIVYPNVCSGNLIQCHGISSAIEFNDEKSLPVMLPVQLNVADSTGSPTRNTKARSYGLHPLPVLVPVKFILAESRGPIKGNMRPKSSRLISFTIASPARPHVAETSGPLKGHVRANAAPSASLRVAPPVKFRAAEVANEAVKEYVRAKSPTSANLTSTPSRQ